MTETERLCLLPRLAVVVQSLIHFQPEIWYNLNLKALWEVVAVYIFQFLLGTDGGSSATASRVKVKADEGDLKQSSLSLSGATHV